MKFINVRINCRYQTIGIISIFAMILTSITGFYLVPSILSNIFKDMNLRPGSEKRLLWEQMPFPMKFKIYVFNITNPMEYIQGMKANLKEIGPYVFDSVQEKKIIKDDDTDDSLTFRQIDTYFFRPDLSSKLTGNEIVTVPHPILMGGLIASQRDKDRVGLMSIIIEAFKQIFQPGETPLLTVKTNGTESGKFKINRGIKDINEIGKVISYEDSNTTGLPKKECSKIYGTEGSNYPPLHQKGESFFAYLPGLCRTLEFKYQKDSSFEGVPTSIYTYNYGDDNNPECYCRQGDSKKCPPKGSVDTYPCGGSPMIVSKPHFFNADKSLLKNVDGLKPNRTLHESVFHFEMYSASTVSVRSRNQISLDIERVDGFDLMANITPAIVPIIWVEDVIDLTEKEISQLRQAYLLVNLSEIVTFVGIFGGSIGILYSVYKKYEKTRILNISGMEGGQANVAT